MVDTPTSSSTLCSTCSVDFANALARREHMRSDWHVFNVKRRVAELPPVPLDFYHSEVLRQPSSIQGNATQRLSTDSPRIVNDHSQRDDDDDDDDDGDAETDDDAFIFSPEQCLFCSTTHSNSDANLLHMAAVHGFHIPNPQHLETDVDTFLAYLSMVVHRFHTCLLCGHQKHSGPSIQAHMLDKGHCMLDMSPDSDFLAFWQTDSDDEDAPQHYQSLSETELRLASGAIVSSRNDGRPTAKSRRTIAEPRESTSLVTTSTSAPADDDTPQPHHHQDRTPSTSKPPSQALAKRDMMGIIGLSDQQKRALARVQHKTISRERRHETKARWTVEKFNNKTKQKHFVVSRSGVHSAMQVY